MKILEKEFNSKYQSRLLRDSNIEDNFNLTKMEILTLLETHLMRNRQAFLTFSGTAIAAKSRHS